MHIKKYHIAPCGMNCHLCMAYFKAQGKMPNRQNSKCQGCNGSNSLKPQGCRNCSITKCVKSKKIRYCFECDQFPCRRIKQLDKRYRTKYEMSMIDNLEYIQKYGIRKFVKNEQKRWQKGNKIYCVHHHKYYDMVS